VPGKEEAFCVSMMWLDGWIWRGMSGEGGRWRIDSDGEDAGTDACDGGADGLVGVQWVRTL